MKYKLQKIRWILAVFWMVFIFTFSAQPAKESGAVSIAAGRLVGNFVIPGFQDMSDRKQCEFAENIEYGIRKTAHATEYAVLAMLTMWCLEPVIEHKKKRLVIAFVISVIYAGTDEFHQLFVIGRSGQVKDVLIDSGGALMGIVLYMALRAILCAVDRYILGRS